MSMVRCYPIGAVRMLDNNEIDDKIIAIPFEDPTWITLMKFLNCLHILKVKLCTLVFISLEKKPTAAITSHGRKKLFKLLKKQ